MNFRLFLEMSDINALLAAVFARPDDETPRLVAADWCDDHGYTATATYIRACVEAARGITPADGIALVPKMRELGNAADNEISGSHLTINPALGTIHLWGADGGVTNYTVTHRGLTIQHNRVDPDRRTRTYQTPVQVAVAALYLIVHRHSEAAMMGVQMGDHRFSWAMSNLVRHAQAFRLVRRRTEAINMLNAAKDLAAVVKQNPRPRPTFSRLRNVIGRPEDSPFPEIVQAVIRILDQCGIAEDEPDYQYTAVTRPGRALTFSTAARSRAALERDGLI